MLSCLCGEPFLQHRIPLLNDHVMDGIGQCLGGTDYDADSLCPGDTRIDEVSLKHHEMSHQYWDDHYGVFRALRLVDGCGICQGQFVKFRVLVFHMPFLEADC